MVIVACSSPQMQEQSLHVICTYGKVLYFAGLAPDRSPIRFDSNVLHYKLASVHGTYGSTLYQNRQALQLIAAGFTRRLIGSRFTLEQVTQAFEAAMEGKSLKVLIEP